MMERGKKGNEWKSGFSFTKNKILFGEKPQDQGLLLHATLESV
jgi:hypothetical protein